MVTLLLGHIGMHDMTNTKHCDLESGKIFNKIAHGEDVSKGTELGIDDGVYLMQRSYDRH